MNSSNPPSLSDEIFNERNRINEDQLEHLIQNTVDKQIPALIIKLIEMCKEKESDQEIIFDQYQIYFTLKSLFKVLDCLKINKRNLPEYKKALTIVKNYVERKYNEYYGSDSLDFIIKCDTLRIVLYKYILSQQEYKIPPPIIAILFIEEN